MKLMRCHIKICQSPALNEDFHTRTKKSEIYSVGNVDLKFDAKQALGCKKNSWINIGFAVHTLTQYILRHCQIQHKLSSLVLDCFVTETLPIAISSKEQ